MDKSQTAACEEEWEECRRPEMCLRRDDIYLPMKEMGGRWKRQRTARSLRESGYQDMSSWGDLLQAARSERYCQDRQGRGEETAS